jgi:hypothetical protein
MMAMAFSVQGAGLGHWHMVFSFSESPASWSGSFDFLECQVGPKTLLRAWPGLATAYIC